ncbi:hypothetical protein RQP46_002413 [Phenoliferia psychrophenolica]
MAHASFNTLPLELKARIVEMASDQEDAWTKRVKDTTTVNERAAHINSLSALALVSEELRVLAARHQFRVLLSRRASEPVFRNRILPRYGHHIVSITFANLDHSKGIAFVFSIMAHLPALRQLVFSRTTARWLFGTGIKLRDDHISTLISTRVEIISLVAKNIDSLVLQSFKPAEAVGLLTHLIVDLPAETVRGWPTEALGPLKRDPPPLKTLQLLWFPLDHHTLDFVSLFEETLETLCLDVWSPGPEVDLSRRDSLRLPRLAHLNLSASDIPLREAMRLLPISSAFSSFSLGDSSTFINLATDPDLLSFLDSNPTLRHLKLGEFTEVYPLKRFPLETLLPPSSLAAYADLVHSRGLDPSVLDAPRLSPFHPGANLGYTEEDSHILLSALRRTLAFGQVELERMVAEGNVKKAEGWVATLKVLEDERLLIHDPTSSLTAYAALERTLAFGKVELERIAAEGNVEKAVGWVKKLKALEDEKLEWRD